MVRDSRPVRLFVTGTKGQVATALLERGAARGAEVVALGRPDLDLADPASIEACLARAACDVVVSAAAYTAVDKAESEPDLARAVNADGAGALARAAAKRGLPIIHLSTDYVFDGGGSLPWREDDPTGPTSVYGRTKLEGEHRVAEAGPRHVIARTAWVYSPFGANFVKTMLRLGATRDELSVVADQHGNPTSALDIADAVLSIASRLWGEPDRMEHYGTFHLVGGGETTWAGLAEAVFAAARRRGGRDVRVRPITTAEYPTPARRPANSRLDTSKLARVYGLSLPPWETSLEACVDRLMRDAPNA